MKIPKTLKKDVDDSEGSFTPIPDGVYVGKLLEVKPSDGDGPSGFPYWSWQFEIPEGQPEYAKRQFFNTTSLSPKAAFKLKEAYDAFAVPTDTDTEELIGHLVLMQVGHRTIQKGERAGELANQIERLMPYEDLSGEGDDNPGF